MLSHSGSVWKYSSLEHQHSTATALNSDEAKKRKPGYLIQYLAAYSHRCACLVDCSYRVQQANAQSSTKDLERASTRPWYSNMTGSRFDCSKSSSLPYNPGEVAQAAAAVAVKAGDFFSSSVRSDCWGIGMSCNWDTPTSSLREWPLTAMPIFSHVTRGCLHEAKTQDLREFKIEMVKNGIAVRVSSKCGLVAEHLQMSWRSQNSQARWSPRRPIRVSA